MGGGEYTPFYAVSGSGLGGGTYTPYYFVFGSALGGGGYTPYYAGHQSFSYYGNNFHHYGLRNTDIGDY